MKYLLTYKDEENCIDEMGWPPPEEDLELFDTEEELVAYLVTELTFNDLQFLDSPYFDKKFTAKELWKPPKDQWVRKSVVRTLVKTLEDLENLSVDIRVYTTFDWYEVEDDYTLTGRHHMSEGLYDALYDPISGHSYMSTIGHVPGYRD